MRIFETKKGNLTVFTCIDKYSKFYYLSNYRNLRSIDLVGYPQETEILEVNYLVGVWKIKQLKQ